MAEDEEESVRAWQASESRQTTGMVYAVLDRLSASDRAILILVELEGFTGEETAKILEISLSNVWVRLHRRPVPAS